MDELEFLLKELTGCDIFLTRMKTKTKYNSLFAQVQKNSTK